MKPILVPMAPGFEEIELTAPIDILRRLGIEVVTAGLESRSVPGAHGITIQADSLLVDAESDAFDGIILPGGGASWTLRDTPRILKLVQEFMAAEKLVAAICAAPIALEAAGVLRDKRVTCYPAVKAELRSAAEVTDEAAVTDGNIVTGRGPGAALAFGYALAAYLGKGEEVARLRADMCAE